MNLLSANLGHVARAVSERIDWRINCMEHGNKEVGQRNFTVSRKGMQLPMFEAKVATASELNGIVFGAMRSMRMG